MKRTLLYAALLLASLTMTMCTPKQETATESDSTVVEAVDTVEAKTDTTVVIVDSVEVN
jgi:hypothetical protein